MRSSNLPRTLALTAPLLGLLLLNAIRGASAYPGDVFQVGAAAAPRTEAPPGASGDEAELVGPSGGSQYAMALGVPPGRQGMQPALALAYASQNPVRGGVAAGWQMALPRIEVDTSQGRVRPGCTPSATNLCVAFKSTLSGTRLVAVDEGLAGAQTFRAENDPSFTRYE